MTEAAAILAAVLFAAVASVQIALALGAPLGGIVLGGRRPGPLSARLRGFSAVASVVLLMAALVVLSRAGAIEWRPIPGDLLGPATWAIVALMALNTLANVASRSRFERIAFGGATALLVLLCAFVALTGTQAG